MTFNQVVRGSNPRTLIENAVFWEMPEAAFFLISKVRHPEDYELFIKYGAETVRDPDIIIKDGKNEGTVFMIRKLPNTNLNVVVRVALETDEEGLKNSVMTFYRIRERNLRKMVEKNSGLIGKDSVLYKKE